MKNIFALTKTEQRVVIFTVAALLVLVAIRAYRQKITNPAPSISAPAAAQPIAPRQEEESGTFDGAP
jgi:hypothetical protein